MSSKSKAKNAQDGALIMPLEDKLHVKECSKDDLLGEGWVPSSNMPVLCPGVEKAGNLSSTKSSQCQIHYIDEYISDSGQADPERPQAGNASSRDGNSPNKEGQVDDDMEELTIASVSAHGARQQACSAPFWKIMEPMFSPTTPDDLLLLKQPRPAEVFNENQSQDVIIKTKTSREHNSVIQGSASSAASFDGLDTANTFHASPSLFQRVLAALIDEDEIEREGVQSNDESAVNLQPQDDVRMDTDFEGKTTPSDSDSHATFRSCFSNSEQCQAGDGPFLTTEVRLAKGLKLIYPSRLQKPLVSSNNCQYQALSLDDKLLLEMQSLDLHPKMEQPHPKEEAPTAREINELQEKLRQKASVVKEELKKIEKTIEYEQDSEKRNTEEAAFDKLVEIAYKRTACRGRKSSARVQLRQKNLAFVERTLDRCKEYETTGRSCFSHPNLQDAMFSAPCKTKNKPVENSHSITEGTQCNGSGRRGRLRASASTSVPDGTINKRRRQRRRRDQILDTPLSSAEEVGEITQPGGLNSGAKSETSNIIIEQDGVGDKKVKRRRYNKRNASGCFFRPPMNNSAPATCNEEIPKEKCEPIFSTTAPQNPVPSGEASGVNPDRPLVIVDNKSKEQKGSCPNNSGSLYVEVCELTIPSKTVPQNPAHSGEAVAVNPDPPLVVVNDKSKGLIDSCPNNSGSLSVEARDDVGQPSGPDLDELVDFGDLSKLDDIDSFLDSLDEPEMDYTEGLAVPNDDLSEVEAALKDWW